MHIHLFSFLSAMVTWQYQRVERSRRRPCHSLCRRAASGARQCMQQSDGGCNPTLKKIKEGGSLDELAILGGHWRAAFEVCRMHAIRSVICNISVHIMATLCIV